MKKKIKYDEIYDHCDLQRSPQWLLFSYKSRKILLIFTKKKYVSPTLWIFIGRTSPNCWVIFKRFGFIILILCIQKHCATYSTHNTNFIAAHCCSMVYVKNNYLSVNKCLYFYLDSTNKTIYIIYINWNIWPVLYYKQFYIKEENIISFKATLRVTSLLLKPLSRCLEFSALLSVL